MPSPAPFTGFQPRKNLYRNRETSTLSSHRERASLLHDWQSLRQGSDRSDKTVQMLLQMRQEIARLAQRSQSALGMYPFRIYNFPKVLRRFPNDNDWRRVKVRMGFVMPTVATFFSVDYTAPGSDAGAAQFDTLSGGPYGNTYFGAEQQPPNSNATTVSDGVTATWNEFLVAQDDVTYVIWYSFVLPNLSHPGGFTNFYAHGLAACKPSDPTTAVILNTGETFDATNTWPTMSVNDLYNYRIGTVFVNNTTFPDQPKGLYITQFQFGNILLQGNPYGTGAEDSPTHPDRIALNFRGAYNASALYYVGDVVTITYTDASTVSSNYQYVYDPKGSSSYTPTTLLTPMSGVSPNGNSPDPWKLLSKSPSAADYHNDATYQPGKYYLRTS